jgi:hypothetical protein
MGESESDIVLGAEFVGAEFANGRFWGSGKCLTPLLKKLKPAKSDPPDFFFALGTLFSTPKTSQNLPKPK